MEHNTTQVVMVLGKKGITALSPLQGAAGNLDTDRDKKLSHPEIFQRIRKYQAMNVNTQALVEVQVKNQRLLDAEIEFEPEDFLADIITTAFGLLDPRFGITNMTTDRRAV